MLNRIVAMLWLFMVVPLGWGQPGKVEAERVWRAMLAAKGDTSGIRTLRILTRRRALFAPEPQTVQVVMAELPGAWWWYFEEPKPLWDGLRVFDLGRDAGWEWSGSSGRVEPLNARRMDWGMVIEARTVAVLFGALGEFQPEPVAVEPVREGFATRDRLTLRWREYALVYDVDRGSHLPVRVDMARTVPAHDVTSQRTGDASATRHVAEFTAHEVYAMGDYHRVGGVMVPGKVRSFGVWSRREVAINPPLDRVIFAEPPRVVDGGAGWQRFAGTW